MANIIEKNLPAPLRKELKTLIATSLAFVLGLLYNDYIRKLISRFVPETGNLVTEGLILIGLTILIVYATVAIKNFLDGK